MHILLKNFFLVLLLVKYVNAQNELQYVEFYYPNGNISSKGYLRNNKPDGYWITFYENGNIKSEGNRKNFELDSLWKFYDENGNIVLEVNYCAGKKCGNRITYTENEVIVEQFENDVKNGYTYIYTKDGKLKRKTFFANGLEEGDSYEYDTDGRIITIFQYRKGYLISREYINRYNSQGKKHGVWVEFYEDGKIKERQDWRNGLLDGYVKTFDRNGNLEKIERYRNGELVVDSKDIKILEIKYDYYDDGKVKIAGSYYMGIPEGVRREYDRMGNIIKSYFFINGKIILEGIIDEKGLKQGEFKEYYETGVLSAEGRYKDSRPVGYWKYYYPGGNLYQEGEYDSKGRKTGKWLTYFDNGQIQKEEYFEKDLHEGEYKEYDVDGNIIVIGQFTEGEEQGKWTYVIGDVIEEKEYLDGKEHGKWKIIDKETKRLLYVGNYIEGLPDGKHIYYWPNGNIRIEGYYIMGLKEREWNYYDENGQLIVRVLYKNGIERKYNRVSLFPDIEE